MFAFNTSCASLNDKVPFGNSLLAKELSAAKFEKPETEDFFRGELTKWYFGSKTTKEIAPISSENDPRNATAHQWFFPASQPIFIQPKDGFHDSDQTWVTQDYDPSSPTLIVFFTNVWNTQKQKRELFQLLIDDAFQIWQIKLDVYMDEVYTPTLYEGTILEVQCLRQPTPDGKWLRTFDIAASCGNTCQYETFPGRKLVMDSLVPGFISHIDVAKYTLVRNFKPSIVMMDSLLFMLPKYGSCPGPHPGKRIWQPVSNLTANFYVIRAGESSILFANGAPPNKTTTGALVQFVVQAQQDEPQEKVGKFGFDTTLNQWKFLAPAMIALPDTVSDLEAKKQFLKRWKCDFTDLFATPENNIKRSRPFDALTIPRPTYRRLEREPTKFERARLTGHRCQQLAEKMEEYPPQVELRPDDTCVMDVVQREFAQGKIPLAIKITKPSGETFIRDPNGIMMS